MVFFLFFLLLIFSICFSSYETAFYSLKKKVAHSHNSSILFSLNVILIGNATVRVLFSELGGYHLEEYLRVDFGLLGGISHLLVIIFISLVLIIFGESIPLNFGIMYPKVVQKSLQWFISLASVLFYVIAKPLSLSIYKMISFLQRKNDANAQTGMTEEEVRSIIQLSYEREVVNPHEKQLTDAVITLYSQTVGFYMTPRRDIVSVELEDSLSLVWKKMKEENIHSILVQQDTIDNILGYLALEKLAMIPNVAYSPILVKEIQEKIDPHTVIPESKKLIDAIEIMRKSPRSMGVVIDEYGGLEGSVTLHQLLGGLLVFENNSKFLGPSNHNGNKEGINIEVLEGGILVNALRTTLRMVLEYFAQELEWVPEEEWSIGRLILKKLDRFPKEGEELQIKNLHFRIVKMQNWAIQKVFISLVEGPLFDDSRMLSL